MEANGGVNFRSIPFKKQKFVQSPRKRVCYVLREEKSSQWWNIHVLFLRLRELQKELCFLRVLKFDNSKIGKK